MMNNKEAHDMYDYIYIYIHILLLLLLLCNIHISQIEYITYTYYYLEYGLEDYRSSFWPLAGITMMAISVRAMNHNCNYYGARQKL